MKRNANITAKKMSLEESQAKRLCVPEHITRSQNISNLDRQRQRLALSTDPKPGWKLTSNPNFQHHRGKWICTVRKFDRESSKVSKKRYIP